MYGENKFGVDEWLWNEFSLLGVFYSGRTVNDVIYAKQMNEYEIFFVMDDNKKYIYDGSQQGTRHIPNNFDEMTEKWFHKDTHIRLYSKIKQTGIRQAELSEITGISQGTISNYTNGYTSPTVDNLFKIAKALGCRVEDLIYVEDAYR